MEHPTHILGNMNLYPIDCGPKGVAGASPAEDFLEYIGSVEVAL